MFQFWPNAGESQAAGAGAWKFLSRRLLNRLPPDLCSSNSDLDTDIVDHIIVKKENTMRKIVLGAAGLVLVLGVADANAIPLDKDASHQGRNPLCHARRLGPDV